MMSYLQELVFRVTRHDTIRSKVSIDDFALLKGECEFLGSYTSLFGYAGYFLVGLYRYSQGPFYRQFDTSFGTRYP